MKLIQNLLLSIRIFTLRHRAARDYRKLVKDRKQVAELLRLSRRDIDSRLRGIRRKRILVEIAKATIKRNGQRRRADRSERAGSSFENAQSVFQFAN